jgi:acyl-CoA synthetase (AMP-forming)/AMP-acid ligase II
VALVLHTSGTTSRPKIVPLTQRNVFASAQHIAHSTRFTAQDRGLNVMPLFHIHGLIAGILAPLSQGGEVHCTSGFNALKFFAQMDEVKPTWYTAVPTMHQAILSRATNNKEVIARVPLRFIRSSSSSLPPQVLAELEATFHAPVIEAYGMTEAAHQMACNPLPPAQRKPGTVGIAAGPEVAIMDMDGHLLKAGDTGEIVIRGPNVTPGYENNDKANAEAFTHGWFRTGDQGMMDSEGYISITGRLKEIINRGGEKISPREIDEILMDHAAVAQVVCFGIPHDKLGEEVGAAGRAGGVTRWAGDLGGWPPAWGAGALPLESWVLRPPTSASRSPTRLLSSAAWALSSSAALADSSAAAALDWVTLSISPMAEFTWPMPCVCSLEAVAISETSVSSLRTLMVIELDA